MKLLRLLLARLLPAREIGPPAQPTRQEALFYAAACYRRALLLQLEVAPPGRYSRVTPAHLTYEAIQERVKRGWRRGRPMTPVQFLREIQRQGDA